MLMISDNHNFRPEKCLTFITGSNMMKRIAAPMIGGVFSSFILELMVYPPIYELWKWNFELKRQAPPEGP